MPFDNPYRISHNHKRLSVLTSSIESLHHSNDSNAYKNHNPEEFLNIESPGEIFVIIVLFVVFLLVRLHHNGLTKYNWHEQSD